MHFCLNLNCNEHLNKKKSIYCGYSYLSNELKFSLSINYMKKLINFEEIKALRILICSYFLSYSRFLWL